jgi:hypothetical protein
MLLPSIQRLAKQAKIGMSRASSESMEFVLPILALLASAAHWP